MTELAGKVAAITGAASGIGRAVAIEMARHGCNIAIADIDRAGMDETQRLIASAASDVKVTIHRVDVSSAASVEQFAGEVVTEHGAVHLIFNNAGITLQKRFENHSLDDWQRMIGINLWGVIYGCKFFIPALRASGGGHIVNTSSMAAFLGLPTQSSYCATEAALKGLYVALWAELAGEGIRLTSVHPGAVMTEMIQATLAESDNMAIAQKNYKLAQAFGVSPELAAKIIVRAVRKNRMRVRVGFDSVLLDVLKRLLPRAIHWPMGKLFKSLMS